MIPFTLGVNGTRLYRSISFANHQSLHSPANFPALVRCPDSGFSDQDVTQRKACPDRYVRKVSNAVNGGLLGYMIHLVEEGEESLELAPGGREGVCV